MGGPLRPLGDARGVPHLANPMAQNLAVSLDYRSVAPAQALANQGQLVIGAWFNPNGHGHVVTVRPEWVPGDARPPRPGEGPLLNNVGASDAVERQSRAFKSADQVHYYTPNEMY